MSIRKKSCAAWPREKGRHSFIKSGRAIDMGTAVEDRKRSNKAARFERKR